MAPTSAGELPMAPTVGTSYNSRLPSAGHAEFQYSHQPSSTIGGIAQH